MLDANPDAPLWSDQELADVLKHQLAAPVVFELSRLEHTDAADLQQILDTAQPPINSFADLLSHPAPPLELLRLTKNFAKAATLDQESPVPNPVAMTLYYAAIAAALVRHRQRLSTMDDAVLSDGLRWVLSQSWVDGQVRMLLDAAQALLTADKAV
jgi:hypothetical protein